LTLLRASSGLHALRRLQGASSKSRSLGFIYLFFFSPRVDSTPRNLLFLGICRLDYLVISSSFVSPLQHFQSSHPFDCTLPKAHSIAHRPSPSSLMFFPTRHSRSEYRAPFTTRLLPSNAFPTQNAMTCHFPGSPLPLSPALPVCPLDNP